MSLKTGGIESEPTDEKGAEGPTATRVWIDPAAALVRRVEVDATAGFRQMASSAKFKSVSGALAQDRHSLLCALSLTSDSPPLVISATRRVNFDIRSVDSPLPASTFAVTPEPTSLPVDEAEMKRK